METAVVNGNGTETGHIIVTTIGGRDGQPKQVHFAQFNNHSCNYLLVKMWDEGIDKLNMLWHESFRKRIG